MTTAAPPPAPGSPAPAPRGRPGPTHPSPANPPPRWSRENPAPDGKPLNKNEQMKLAKDGLAVLDDLIRHSEAGDFDAIDPLDLDGRFRWFGVYQQKPKGCGYFMLRIKLPGGQLNPAQLQVLAQVADESARGFCDITTRQDIQYHWITIRDIKGIFEKLATVGINTQFACGDTPRNVVGCPLAGVLKDEIIDASDAIQQVADLYYRGGPEFSNLPRKYKTSAGGCPIHCQQPQINDLAFYGVRRPSGQVGYGLLVGGGLSDTPHYAQPMRAFVRPEQVVDVARAVAHVFRDYGYREKRNRARLKFLVEDMGWQWTRDRIEEDLGYALEHDDALLHPPAVHSDHMGIGEQKDGRHFVGVPIERGRLTSRHMFALADLSEKYAAGAQRIRLTAKQNLILLDVPGENLAAVEDGLNTVGLPPRAHRLRNLLIACTGSEFCNLAVVETKHRAGRVLAWLEQNLAADHDLMIAFVGCPNSCAQYQIADIGLTGTPTADPLLKDEKGKPKKVDGYRVLLGGQLGSDPKFGEYINKKQVVPADRIHLSLKSLIETYQAERTGPEDQFPHWVQRTEPERLLKLIVEPAMAADAVPLPA